MIVSASQINILLKDEGIRNINDSDIDQIIATLFPKHKIKEILYDLTHEEIEVVMGVVLNDFIERRR